MDRTLRLCSPATSPRITTQELAYRDVTIPAGTRLFFPVSLSGRAPRAFSNPDHFDPERPRENRHLEFGLGMHLFLVTHPSLAQIHEGLHRIPQRTNNTLQARPAAWQQLLSRWA